MVTDRGLATTGWEILRRCSLPCEQAERRSPGSCIGSRLAQAKASVLPDECIRILENKVQQEETAMKQTQPLGEKMDQARARFRRAVQSGKKALQARQKAQENFEQALLMQEAPLPVMPVPHVNVSLVKTSEVLTGIIENLWNPDAGQPPEHLTHAIQESRQILQTSSVLMSQEGGAALEAELVAGQGTRAMGSGRRRRRGDGRLRGGACSGWAAGRSDSVKGTQSCNGEHTDNTAAEEDAHCGASGCGAGWCPVLAGPKVVSTSSDDHQR